MFDSKTGRTDIVISATYVDPCTHNILSRHPRSRGKRGPALLAHAVRLLGLGLKALTTTWHDTPGHQNNPESAFYLDFFGRQRHHDSPSHSAPAQHRPYSSRQRYAPCSLSELRCWTEKLPAPYGRQKQMRWKACPCARLPRTWAYFVVVPSAGGWCVRKHDREEGVRANPEQAYIFGSRGTSLRPLSLRARQCFKHPDQDSVMCLSHVSHQIKILPAPCSSLPVFGYTSRSATAKTTRHCHIFHEIEPAAYSRLAFRPNIS